MAESRQRIHTVERGLKRAACFTVFAAVVFACDATYLKTSAQNKTESAQNNTDDQEFVTMTNSKLVEALDKIDRDLFFLPGQKHIEEAYALLSDSEVEGVAIGLPEQVIISKQTQLPLLVAISQSAQRAAAFPLAEHARIICEEEKTGKKQEMMLFETPKGKIPMLQDKKPPPPADPLLPMHTIIVEGVDLRSRFNLPWAPSSYWVNVTIGDWSSNRVRVDLSAN